MKNRNEANEWKQLWDQWKTTPPTRGIHNQLSYVLSKVKTKVSSFEKEAINRDLSLLKANRNRLDRVIGNLEKDSITRDVLRIKTSLKRFLGLLTK